MVAGVVCVVPTSVGAAVGVDCSMRMVVGIQDSVGTVLVASAVVVGVVGRAEGISDSEDEGTTGGRVEEGSSTRSLVFEGTELVDGKSDGKSDGAEEGSGTLVVPLPMVSDCDGKALGSLDGSLDGSLEGSPEGSLEGSGRSEVVLLPGTRVSPGETEGGSEVTLGGNDSVVETSGGVVVSWGGRSDSVELALMVGD